MNVLDASGRRLHTPLDRQLPAGRHDFGWDLRNDNGDRLPSGIYFLQLQVDGRQEPRKITIVK